MLQRGSKGNEVISLQQKLIARGYSCGSAGADGDFGQGTFDAVCAFQRDHGLDVDGIVGTNTMNAINGSAGSVILRLGSKGALVKELQEKLISKGYSCGLSGADGDFGQGTFDAVIAFQTVAGLSTDGIVGPMTWDALNGLQSNSLLKLGSKGSEVRALQEKLIARGYSCGSTGADGDFGYDTYKAVMSFQESHGLLADGIVGQATWSVLRGIDNTIMLKIGSKGDAVRELQQKLIARGYNCGASGADGDFGQGTYNAVIKLQADYGLDQDGVVGPLTWDALNSSTFSELLKMGSKGESVRRLQQRLSVLGYNLGPSGADGDFGQATYNAVVAFQSSHGLSVDGVVGSETWNALFGTASYELLRIGSKGEAVRRLQQMLISLGYNLGSSGADGDFGQATYNAVVAFQSSHGLSIDGIVGSETWNALYGFGSTTSPIVGCAGVKKFLEVAKHEADIAYKESYDNMTKYGAWYKNNGVAWCAIFVSWCANQAGILNGIVPRYSWCENAVNWYCERGRYRRRTSGYTPLPGDIIFYNDGNSYYHTGIVEYVSSGKVHTIEGNAGPNTDGVYRITHDINWGNIHGYGQNGGIEASDDEILREAGMVGVFKNMNYDFPGFSKEIPVAMVSLRPRITVSAIISRAPVVVDGKVYQIGSNSIKEASASITDGINSAGIAIDISADSIKNTLSALNYTCAYGDIFKYTVDIKPYRVIEITVQFKAKAKDVDIYQGILIRIEQAAWETMYIPVYAGEVSSTHLSTINDYKPYIIVGGFILLAIGIGAAAPLLLAS